jgi:hypothetical protein
MAVPRVQCANGFLPQSEANAPRLLADNAVGFTLSRA